MIVIPAIDIIDGKCVRLRRGDKNTSKIYDEDPVEVARRWKDAGAERIHVVDLDGAFAGDSKNFQTISKIIEKVGVPLEVGGGIRTSEAVDCLIERGVAYVVIGTIVVEQPQLSSEIVERHPGKIYIGIDSRAGLVATRGWERTSERTTNEIAERAAEWQARGIIFTAIERDGEMIGPDFLALSDLLERAKIPVIASGGVTTLDDLKRLAAVPGIEGAIVGKALYEGRIDINDALTIQKSCPQ